MISVKGLGVWGRGKGDSTYRSYSIQDGVNHGALSEGKTKREATASYQVGVRNELSYNSVLLTKQCTLD